MKRIYIWLKTKWLKLKLRRARSFMEANCLERIKRGQRVGVGEDAIGDWAFINEALNSVLGNSLPTNPSTDILGKTVEDRLNEDKFEQDTVAPDAPKEYIDIALLTHSQLKDILNTYYKSVIPMRRWIFLLAGTAILLAVTLLLRML